MSTSSDTILTARTLQTAYEARCKSLALEMNLIGKTGDEYERRRAKARLLDHIRAYGVQLTEMPELRTPTGWKPTNA